ncbi:hypothetical protein DPMN_142956 [Dreissena polymorpha]|uniref:Uncharacterized protein n=1 Tax=Dreissena polymorpha TaxID=45954 RepID=A0A9D4GGA6_DREPO|nr:hypothetical protein DPMN_142956 [Dreissena polymorpha]
MFDGTAYIKLRSPQDHYYSLENHRPTRGAPDLVMGPCIVEIDRIVRDVQYQFEVHRCKKEKGNLQGCSANSDGRTDGQTAEITTVKKAWEIFAVVVEAEEAVAITTTINM